MGILLAENKSLEMAHLSRRVLPLAYCVGGPISASISVDPLPLGMELHYPPMICVATFRHKV